MFKLINYFIIKTWFKQTNYKVYLFISLKYYIFRIGNVSEAQNLPTV